MNKIILYGIANCDVTRKALAWYKKKNITVEFHDYKISGIRAEKLRYWCQKVDWKLLVNKKSSTWRSLTASEQQLITNEAAAITLMLKYTTVIKRPVIEINDHVIVGFDEAMFNQ